MKENKNPVVALLKSKPIGYIPAEDTVNGEKLYVVVFPKSFPKEQQSLAMNFLRNYIKNCIAIEEGMTFANYENLKEYANNESKQCSH